ncbi:hypothetical protein KFL_004620050 [Klebsormidium nitens]|uniref:Uncharacterized protein n=1 Tax=Klebsormidium nitens TaxID=105231 RepID=A0A1Y1ICY9_KLENI|nr:hypothetical protein KFL_004620050 [Klebsormidium nitens]|eukprot:GAQ88825.1 hypothetical protein KFL_004620050 [Klebsormidium nitens]
MAVVRSYTGDRDLQTACARDLLAVLSGGIDAQDVAPPRADALRSCIRPLVGKLPVEVSSGSQDPGSFEVDQESSRLDGDEGASSTPVLISRSSVRKLVTDLLDTQGRGENRKRNSGVVKQSRSGRQAGQESGLEGRFGALVAQPPAEVMALVRAVDTQRGNGSALRRALSPSHFEFPDCEGSTEACCQLARAPTGQRFSKQVVSRYFALLFEAIAATAPVAGFPVNLSRFDLFHGHFLYARESRRFGILFHAREYPAEDPEAFPVNLGYCQRGSKVRYDETMNLRNLLWLAPREASVARARAPGVLCALDTRPDGILGAELVVEGLQLVHTIFEGDLGVLLGDVNYLGALKRRRLEQRLFIC